MRYLSHSSTYPSKLFSIGSYRFKTLLILAMMVTMASAAFATQSTTTQLAISATSVPYKTPITLTATVTSGGTPVTTGLVLFCEATATFCENNSALGIAQLTFPGATASVKLGSGPIGNHSYKAVYRANNLYSASLSNTVTYAVTGTYNSATTLTSTGTVGNYSLAGTVAGLGSLTTGPTGTISFLDASNGNNLLGTENLVVSTLATTFIQTPPFAIGGPGATNRSLAIASAYLNADNNLDVVTGDSVSTATSGPIPADKSTITVLLGNGDGTFKPQVNYPGCTVGSAVQIVLADFNRDGNTDVALGCSDRTNKNLNNGSGGTNGGLVILLGKGDGTFLAPTFYPTGDVASIATGDFNHDGILDIALTDNAQQNVLFFTGNGDGTFTQQSTNTISTSTAARGVVVSDFNNDGIDDVAYAVADGSLFDLYVAISQPNGTFIVPTTPAATEIGEFLTAGDTNGDNHTDIVSVTITEPGPGGPQIGNSLFVLLGDGTGKFPTTKTYLSDIPSDPNLADVNGDGIPDIIAGGSIGALVYIGNGDGTFQPYAPGSLPNAEPVIGGFALTYAVNAGDYNNDGNADLIGTDNGSARAAVSLSQVLQNSTASALANVAVFPLGSGIHNVDASYSGDSIYIGSISSTVPLTAAPVNTSLTLTASPSTAILTGQAVTLTAVLSPFTVGPPFTTTNGESVNFFNGTTLLGSGTLTNGVAKLVTTALPVGSDLVSAVFPGDSNYNLSTSNAFSATVTNIVLISSLNPSAYLQSVTFTTTVPVGKTGTISFFDGTNNIGTVGITGTTATLTTSSLSVGSHNITSQYNSNVSNVVVQVVNQITPTVTVTTSGPSTYGSPVTITAKVPSGATGTIFFSSGSTNLGSGTVSSGSVSITTTVLLPPSDVITASYSGDTNYTSATGTVTQTVAKASTASTLTSSLNPSTTGNSVTFTDTLPTGVTGTVSFTNGSTVLGSATVTNGIATLTTSSLPAGSDPITASYSGDSNYSSSTATLTQTVNKMTPTVTVTVPGTSVFGQSINITASVPNGPTGTITLTSGGVTLGSGTITASNGTVTISTAILPVGPDVITATYGGDASNNQATGTATQTVTKASPAETLGSSPNPSNTNQAVVFTATLPTNVTGTVTFTHGTTTLGTSNVTSGVATLSVSTLPAGLDTITATYNGDSNNNTATASVTQTVNKVTPVVTVTTSGASTFGASVTITATLPIGTTGTVTFTSVGGLNTLATINPATGTAVISTTVLPVGSDTILASYGGDANYNAATGSVVQNVGKATPTVALTSSLNPSTTGQSVTFTASVPTGVTGSVTFTSGSTVLGTPTLSGGTASVSTSTLPIGSDPITATYNGDGNDNSATGTLTQTVNKATPTITVTTSGPSTYGNPVTITAQLPPGTTGTVTFTSGGVTLGSGPVNSTTGTVTITTTVLPVGTDTITASYGGDTNNGPATGTTTQTVSKVTLSVGLTSSLNPSTYGQSVTFTATLPSGVTGTVSFLDGSTVIGTGTISNGAAGFTTSTLNAGVHPITANYGGDSNNNAASSTTLSQTVNKATPVLPIPVPSSTSPVVGTPVTITETVPPGVSGPVTFSNGGTAIGTAPIVGGTATITVSTLPLGTNQITASTPGDANNNPAISPPASVTVVKTAPTVTVTSSLNPSTVGQAVTFTATAPSGATGTITFLDGATILGTGTLTNAQAALTTSTLIVGSHTITVTYSGDSSNNVATSVPLTQIVNKATPVIPPPVVSNPNVPPNTSETITETVPPGVTGTVTFSNGGTTIGTAPIVGGTATITVPSLPIGTNPITATTSGDTNNNPATSAPTTVTVAKPTPTVTVISSLNPSIVGQAVTFTAAASSSATGSITFLDGATILGTGTLTNGLATLTTSTLTVGAHTITVSYGGDTNNGAATSGPLTQVVNKATPVIPPPVVSNPNVPPNTPETITETVPPGVTGTVTFSDGGTTIGTAPIVGGIATITVPSLPIGTNPITATTSGDANNNPATSSATTVTVSQTPVLVAPTVTPNNPAPNTPVTITEPIPSGVTGPINFYDGGTLLGTGTISGGVATLTIPSLPVGTNQITATGINTTNNGTITSPPTTVTVAKATATVTLASSVNPSAPGQAVTFSATVQTGATGTITFLDGTTILGTGTINKGVASLTTSALTIGTHSITASYSGDTTYSAAVSSVLAQVVGKIPTVTTITVSAPAQLLYTGVTFTANVTAPSPNATGTVTFMDGTTVLGTATLSGNGGVVVSLTTNANAAFATTSLVTGPHQIVAVYSGDSTFAPSTSAPTPDMVEDFTNANSGPASQNVFPGASTTYNFTLTPVGTTTFLNDVTVAIDGLPAGSTYTFSPATIKAGSGATKVTLTVQTSSALNARNRPPQDRPSGHNELPIALGMLGLAGLGTVRKLRHRIPRSLMILLLTIGSLLPIAALSGCAGGYFLPKPTTFPLTVTGTEGAIQHAATATLIVEE
jgi:Bacterial Ig-like domain (group 3)/FG-GAP-like repeat